jgi:hypothetical protein
MRKSREDRFRSRADRVFGRHRIQDEGPSAQLGPASDTVRVDLCLASTGPRRPPRWAGGLAQMAADPARAATMRTRRPAALRWRWPAPPAGARPVHLRPPRSWLAGQARYPSHGEPALPGSHDRHAAANVAGDGRVRCPRRRGQHDPAPKQQPLRPRPGPHDLVQFPAPILRRRDVHKTGTPRHRDPRPQPKICECVVRRPPRDTAKS